MYLSYAVPTSIAHEIGKHLGLDAKGIMSIPWDLPSVACSHGGAKDAIVCRTNDNGDFVLNYLSPLGYYPSLADCEAELNSGVEPGFSLEEIVVKTNEFGRAVFDQCEEPDCFDTMEDAFEALERLKADSSAPEPV